MPVENELSLEDLQKILEEEAQAFKPQAVKYQIEQDKDNKTTQSKKQILEELQLVSNALKDSHDWMLSIYNTITDANLATSISKAVDSFFRNAPRIEQDTLTGSYYELHSLGTAGIPPTPSPPGDELGFTLAFGETRNNIFKTGIKDTFTTVTSVCNECISEITNFFSEMTFFSRRNRNNDKIATLIRFATAAIYNGELDFVRLLENNPKSSTSNPLHYLTLSVNEYQKIVARKKIKEFKEKLSDDTDFQKIQRVALTKLDTIIKDSLGKNSSLSKVVSDALSEDAVKIKLKDGEKPEDWSKDHEFDAILFGKDEIYNAQQAKTHKLNTCVVQEGKTLHLLTIGQALSINQGILFSNSAAGLVNNMLLKTDITPMMKGMQLNTTNVHQNRGPK